MTQKLSLLQQQAPSIDIQTQPREPLVLLNSQQIITSNSHIVQQPSSTQQFLEKALQIPEKYIYQQLCDFQWRSNCSTLITECMWTSMTRKTQEQQQIVEIQVRQKNYPYALSDLQLINIEAMIPILLKILEGLEAIFERFGWFDPAVNLIVFDREFRTFVDADIQFVDPSAKRTRLSQFDISEKLLETVCMLENHIRETAVKQRFHSQVQNLYRKTGVSFSNLRSLIHCFSLQQNLEIEFQDSVSRKDFYEFSQPDSNYNLFFDSCRLETPTKVEGEEDKIRDIRSYSQIQGLQFATQKKSRRKNKRHGSKCDVLEQNRPRIWASSKGPLGQPNKFKDTVSTEARNSQVSTRNTVSPKKNLLNMFQQPRQNNRLIRSTNHPERDSRDRSSNMSLCHSVDISILPEKENFSYSISKEPESPFLNFEDQRSAKLCPTDRNYMLWEVSLQGSRNNEPGGRQSNEEFLSVEKKGYLRRKSLFEDADLSQSTFTECPSQEGEKGHFQCYTPTPVHVNEDQRATEMFSESKFCRFEGKGSKTRGVCVQSSKQSLSESIRSDELQDVGCEQRQYADRLEKEGSNMQAFVQTRNNRRSRQSDDEFDENGSEMQEPGIDWSKDLESLCRNIKTADSIVRADSSSELLRRQSSVKFEKLGKLGFHTVQSIIEEESRVSDQPSRPKEEVFPDCAFHN